MLVVDNDSATNQPIGSAPFHTQMRGEKMPTMQRQEHSDDDAVLDVLALSPSELAWEPALDNTSSLTMTSL